MIASHYAEPVERRLSARSALRTYPSGDSELLFRLDAGEPFLLLDDSLGWAWGYAGKDRVVGYLPSENLGAH